MNSEDPPSTGLRSSWTSPRPCASWKVLGLTLEAIITPTSSSTTLLLSYSTHQKGEVQRCEENSPGTHSTACGGVWTGPGRLTLAILPTGEEAVARGAEAIVAALCVLAGMLAQAPHTALVKVWSRWGQSRNAESDCQVAKSSETSQGRSLLRATPPLPAPPRPAAGSLTPSLSPPSRRQEEGLFS